MRPGGHHLRSNSGPSGAYGNAGAGFRYGSSSTNAPPYRPPPPVQQMTPEQKQEVLLAAGRLAAEYLVAKGELPPHVLQNRPLQERPPAPQHGQTLPRPFQQGGRPLAKQHFQLQQGPPRPFAPRAFQDRPIAKRPGPPAPRPFQGRPQHAPRPFQGRPPFPSGGRAPAPPKTGCIGQGAAQAGSVMQGGGQDAPAGDGSNRQPVPQPGGAAETESPQTTDQPNQR